MILSGKEIQKQVIDRNIVIRPFDPKKVNPNSYNLTLHNELLMYDVPILDMKKANPTRKITIPKEGFLLEPGNCIWGAPRNLPKQISLFLCWKAGHPLGDWGFASM